LPGQLAEAWHRAGLTAVEQTLPTIWMEFTDFGDYWSGWVWAASDYFAKLDTESREELEYLVRAAYLSGDADGARAFAATAWVVRGAVPGR
jgi:hypothetical protein